MGERDIYMLKVVARKREREILEVRGLERMVMG